MTTVLIVDDEDDIRLLVRILLKGADYELIEAADGQEALEIMERADVDIMLLDLRMPRVDGWTVLARLKDERTRRPQVVALSAHAGADAVKRALDNGCTAYVAKPFTTEELLQAINQALAADPD